MSDAPKVAVVMIRPIFDPVLPAEVRDALLDHAEWMRPASGPPPPPWTWWGGVAKDVVRALGVGAVCGVLPGVLAFTGVLGRVGKTVAVTAQAVIVAVWFADVAAGIVTTGVVQALCTLAALVVSTKVYRGVRWAHGHYLMNGDFDAESQTIIARVQAAVEAVKGSSVAATGLLDAVAGGVILGRQEWEIAQALRGPGRNHGSVISRVAALERYAERVHAADLAYAEALAAPGAAGAGDQRLDPAESVALAEIDDLIDDAQRVEDALRTDAGRQ